jgi:hypothetical protein
MRPVGYVLLQHSKLTAVARRLELAIFCIWPCPSGQCPAKHEEPHSSSPDRPSSGNIGATSPGQSTTFW